EAWSGPEGTRQPPQPEDGPEVVSTNCVPEAGQGEDAHRNERQPTSLHTPERARQGGPRRRQGPDHTGVWQIELGDWRRRGIPTMEPDAHHDKAQQERRDRPRGTPNANCSTSKLRWQGGPYADREPTGRSAAIGRKRT